MEVRLKPGKEKAILNKHPWIFSGAIDRLPAFTDGDILPLVSAKGELLASAYFNKKSSIIGRIVAFGNQDPIQAIKQAIRNAIALRKFGFNCYRLINGEGDFLPGLIVDRYGDYLVIQVSTLGMDKLKSLIIEELRSHLNPKGIYEKSLLPSRKEEGLPPLEQVLFGNIPNEIQVTEYGHQFLINVKEGQKTGFFLDQREMRKLVQELAKGKKVLNCFGYTGGFSVYALAGGASHVDTVDISKEAIELAKKNVALNNFSHADFFTEDVFEFLRKNDSGYEIIILDPPAFAKKSKDVVQACRGYKDINRIALTKMPKDSILITSSCSHFVDEKLFQQVIFQAAIEAKRDVQILSKHRQAFDHPVSIFHPEGSYLKSLVLRVI